ncbi:MAG: hypothetical protein IKP08_00045 [Bacteroidales bacterium]|nr:hypothetical protein [Bacteroidales bacterium]
MEQKKTMQGRVVFGATFVVIGLFFLFANLDIDLLGVWRDAVISFPMLCVLFGLVFLVRKRWFAGLTILGLGIFLILPLLPYDVVPVGFCGKWWPVVLIYYGAMMLLFRKVSVPESKENRHIDNMQTTDVTFDEVGKIRCRVSCNGERQIYNESVLKGGNIDVNMGGLELDLRNTTLPEGETVLNINVRLGGVSLLVPNNWNVEIQTSGLGGFADKRSGIVTAESNKKLVLIVNAFMGGGEVR